MAAAQTALREYQVKNPVYVFVVHFLEISFQVKNTIFKQEKQITINRRIIGKERKIENKVLMFCNV